MSSEVSAEREVLVEPPQLKKPRLERRNNFENGQSTHTENGYHCEIENGTPTGPCLMPEGEEHLKLRKKHIASSQQLHFGDYPLNIVRGQGQYFFDEHGHKYLDTVNNVACVGHCHPKVVEACTRQMAVLCTNSRFLYERIGTYAKKLCSTFPEGMSCCFFTNSGSEANDLALQIAKRCTGREHVISLAGCYHGHLSSLRPLSSYKLAQTLGIQTTGFGDSKDPDISFATLPDVYRGKYRDKETAGPLYARDLKELLDAQKKKGKEVAAYIHEPMPSCAGQIVPPKGYLTESYKHVREAGGLVIADEIQTGFARMGDHFWAFEVDGVCPDIVTLGKPMGNGHPVSAVVTTKEIADKFASTGMEYFNSFGGNPVSMAIAEAVLNVIEEESLGQNAKEVGGFLMESLKRLQEKHNCIGDVRGVGLYIGIDIVKDRETRESDKSLAKDIKYKMLHQHRIIVNVDGAELNVIKIKPPLVFSKQDCTQFVQALDVVLSK